MTGLKARCEKLRETFNWLNVIALSRTERRSWQILLNARDREIEEQLRNCLFSHYEITSRKIRVAARHRSIADFQQRLRLPDECASDCK